MGVRDWFENVDLGDRQTQIVLGGGAVALGFAVSKLRHKPADAAAASSAPVSDVFGTTNDPGTGQPGVVGWVGNAPPPPAAAPKPNLPKSGNARVTLVNPAGKVYTGQFPVVQDTSKTCPAGYTLVLGSAGKPECIAIDQRVTKTRSVAPLPKASGDGKGGAGRAGEAFSPFHSAAGPTPDTNPYGSTAYGGRVGSVFPRPWQITASPVQPVLPGESIRQFAGRVYGDESAWPRVANLNNLSGDPGEWQEGQGVRVW